MSCNSKLSWVDNNTVKIGVFVYERCFVDESNYVECVTEILDDNGKPFMWSYTNNIVQEIIKI
jgi:hypothetical protein